uniref:Uncharacterized protein n=1 Tax=Anguilla anguilla TaxID=7936 RepID=A0A0E9S003_ANGAN
MFLVEYQNEAACCACKELGIVSMRLEEGWNLPCIFSTRLAYRTSDCTCVMHCPHPWVNFQMWLETACM